MDHANKGNKHLMLKRGSSKALQTSRAAQGFLGSSWHDANDNSDDRDDDDDRHCNNDGKIWDEGKEKI